MGPTFQEPLNRLEYDFAAVLAPEADGLDHKAADVARLRAGAPELMVNMATETRQELVVGQSREHHQSSVIA